MSVDVLPTDQMAEYRGLVEDLTRAYIKGRDLSTIADDSAEFLAALEALTRFLINTTAETIRPGITA